MKIIFPIKVTASMIGAGATLTEDPTAAWTAGSYATGAEVHMVSTHRVYRSTADGASAVAPNLDPTRWKDMRPTNLMAPFDIYTNTAAISSAVDIVYPLTARFVNAVALWGLAGTGYSFKVFEHAGGALLYERTGRLRRASRGWYDHLFGERQVKWNLLFTNIPIRPAAVIEIKITGGPGVERRLGLVVMGKLHSLMGSSWGGTEWGAEVEPVTFSYIDFDEDGSLVVKERPSATNLNCRVMVPAERADEALALLQAGLTQPAAFLGSDLNLFSGLRAFGLASRATVRYAGPEFATIELPVKGIA